MTAPVRLKLSRRPGFDRAAMHELLAGIDAAQTADELETAIQSRHDHPFIGPKWARISKARIAAGERLCATHPNGRYIPKWGKGRSIEVCGETYRVGRGGNSTGVRYCWHAAKMWAVDVLKRSGLSQRAAYAIWDKAFDYPHRAIGIVTAALAGEYPDPAMNLLIKHKRESWSKPINYSVEKNQADKYDRRATKPCPSCGGTMFDWGSGHDAGFDYINWHCCGCPDVFTEYMTQEELYALRRANRPTCEAV